MFDEYAAGEYAPADENYLAYVLAHEAIVNSLYTCLRKAYDANQFYVKEGGFCGPDTAEVDEDAAGEEALGLRCEEGLCCGRPWPADGVIQDWMGPQAFLSTCQSAEAVTFKTQALHGYSDDTEWGWVCMVKDARTTTVGLIAVIGGMMAMAI